MSSHAALKLIQSSANHGHSPVTFERRRHRRHVISGQVTAVQTIRNATDTTDNQQNGLCNRICSLQLRDISDSGLGAISQEPTETGIPIAVFFSPHGPDNGFDLYGHVTRCTKSASGHEIAIHFNGHDAA